MRLENIIMAIEHMSGGQWCSGQRREGLGESVGKEGGGSNGVGNG